MGRVISRCLYESQAGYLMHWCPACQCRHGFHLAAGPGFRSDWWDGSVNARDGDCWGFDGDVDKPTFSPSMRIISSRPVAGGGMEEYTACHYHLIAGVIHFCGDSAHALAGQIIPLPDWPEHARTL